MIHEKNDMIIYVWSMIYGNELIRKKLETPHLWSSNHRPPFKSFNRKKNNGKFRPHWHPNIPSFKDQIKGPLWEKPVPKMLDVPLGSSMAMIYAPWAMIYASTPSADLSRNNGVMVVLYLSTVKSGDFFLKARHEDHEGVTIWLFDIVGKASGPLILVYFLVWILRETWGCRVSTAICIAQSSPFCEIRGCILIVWYFIYLVGYFHVVSFSVPNTFGSTLYIYIYVLNYSCGICSRACLVIVLWYQLISITCQC